jgi:hypothetical protein
MILTPLPAHLDFNIPVFPFTHCVNKPVSDCTIVKGTGRSILLMGDSHAAMMVPAFTQLAQRDGLTLSVSLMGLCPWQRGLTAPSVAANCHELRHDDYTRLLTELHPDIVVAVDIGYGTPGPYPTLVDDQGHPATNAEMRALTKSSAEALQGNGRKVLLIEPVPLPSKPSDAFDPFACLEKSKFEEQCRYIAAPSPSALDLTYRAAAAGSGGRIRSLDGRIVKFDQSHLTTGFSQSLAPEINSYLERVGFLPRSKS